MTADPYKDFVCSYPFEGGRWTMLIKARSHEEAERRLKALGWGKVDGEHMLTIPASVGHGVVPLFVRLRNWWRA